MFVLMGTFVTRLNAKSVQPSRDTFNSLADIICTCPRLAKEAKFVLIPGPEDAGDNAALPRRGISAKLTEELRRRVKHITFGSNPCRIKYYTQEIVLFREDLCRKIQRHAALTSVNHPNEGEEKEEVSGQIVEAIIDQAHLVPLPLHARPVHWSLDHTLRLTPLPHLIILADASMDKFECEREECIVANPGSFASNSSFIVYRPATKDIEFSKLN